MKSSMLAALVLLAVAGCSSAPAAPSSTHSTAATTPVAGTSSAPATNPPPAPPKTVAVKKYGVSSPECAAASDALMKVTKIGGLANQGKVTQADVDAAFAGAGGLPDGASQIVQGLKATSQKLVGADAASANAFLAEFQTGLGDLVTAAQTICS